MKVKTGHNFDFTAENLKADLTNPFSVTSPRDRKVYRIDSVMLRRLSSIELGMLANRIRKYQTDETTSMLKTALDMISLSAVQFYSGDSPVSDMSASALSKKVRQEDALYLMFLVIMLTRGSSLVSTHYVCSDPSCGAHIHFNLNPDKPVPPNIEPNRLFMQDLADYMYAEFNRTGKEYFDFELKSTVKTLELDSDDQAGEEEGEGNKTKSRQIRVKTYRFRYGSISDFISVLEDRTKSSNPELYFYYDNLEDINGLGKEVTESLKKKYGFEELMRFDISDFRRLGEAAGKFGLVVENRFTCPVCLTENTQDFDYTNLFGSLMN